LFAFLRETFPRNELQAFEPVCVCYSLFNTAYTQKSVYVKHRRTNFFTVRMDFIVRVGAGIIPFRVIGVSPFRMAMLLLTVRVCVGGFFVYTSILFVSVAHLNDLNLLCAM